MTSAFPPPVFIVAFTTLTLTVCTLLEIADAGILVKCALTKPIEDGPGAVDSDITLHAELRSMSGKGQLSTIALVTSQLGEIWLPRSLFMQPDCQDQAVIYKILLQSS